MTLEANSAIFHQYEYKELFINHSKVSLFIDSYKNFGWKLDTNIHPSSHVDLKPKPSSSHLEESKVKLYFKRPMNITNKVELIRLENNFESCIKQITIMEKKKISIAQIYALTLGLLGLLSAVISVISFSEYKIVSLLTAFIALTNIISPYIIYNKIRTRESQKLAPMIQQQYAEIEKICHKGYSLCS